MEDVSSDCVFDDLTVFLGVYINVDIAAPQKNLEIVGEHHLFHFLEEPFGIHFLET